MIYIYTYKTTIRVIRRLWGGKGGRGVARSHNIGPTLISHRTRIAVTSISHRYHIKVASASHLSYHVGIESISQWPHIGFAPVLHRYHIGIAWKYRIGITTV